MDLELKIDKNIDEPKIVLYTNQITQEISDFLDTFSNISKKTLNLYKDDKIYIINQNDVDTIYSEKGKVFVKCDNQIYFSKNRLYEIEALLDKSIFLRISNSEIVNISKVESIDLKVIGTLILHLKNGYTAYSSRRYIPRIKEFLKI